MIQAHGDGERNLKKLSDQTGVSVTRIRQTYLHLDVKPEEFEAIRTFGSR